MSVRERAVQLHGHALACGRLDPAMSYRTMIASVEADPGYAEGWLHLGVLLRDMGNGPAASAAFRTGLRCDPDDGLTHKLLLNLGHCLMVAGSLDEAEESTDAAIRIGCRIPLDKQVTAYALANRSLIWAHRAMDGVALVDARRSYEMYPDTKTELAYAFALLFDRQYSEGLRRFEARFEDKIRHWLNLPYPRWDGGKTGTLVVLPDMGLGDTLSFSRFVPLAALHVERVVFAVQVDLVRLLTPIFAGTNVEVVPADYQLPIADAWCPVFGLPTALGLSDEEIAEVDFALGREENPPMGEGFNIAIAWAGAPGNDIDRHRSIPVTEFLALREVPGVRLWSVQVGPRVKDLHDTGCAGLMRDLSPYIRDASDTATLLQRMDLVVTCESFVGHLAGSLGVKCWVAASRLGRDWRIGSVGESALWYPGTRVWRQGEDRGWGPVFKAMGKELRNERVDRRHSEHDSAGPDGRADAGGAS